MKEPSAEQIAALSNYTDAIERLYSQYATRDSQAVRLHDVKNVSPDGVRSQFAMDADRIIYSKFFNRGADKTQVFSFYKNDDITRRASHVQLVSRVARSIGKALKLNLELIEAIAIGHDIGHTPFGHAGERYLDELYNAHAGKRFNHNVHSVRVLNYISHNNLTIQTLDGILCHCGEKVDERYEPSPLPTRAEFEQMFSDCYTQADAVHKLRPATLEGCVVRISDMIAYIGKDRQDAMYSLGLRPEFECDGLGTSNSAIINAVTNDLIANSMDKPYLSLSSDVYDLLEQYKKENYEKIYKLPIVNEPYETIIKPMMGMMYDKCLADVVEQNTDAAIYRHYLLDPYVKKHYFGENTEKLCETPDDMVVDYIACMTDDYFLDAFRRFFPDSELNDKVRIFGYFVD